MNKTPQDCVRGRHAGSPGKERIGLAVRASLSVNHGQDAHAAPSGRTRAKRRAPSGFRFIHPRSGAGGSASGQTGPGCLQPEQELIILYPAPSREQAFNKYDIFSFNLSGHAVLSPRRAIVISVNIILKN
jgi:hypothetical protein